MALPKVKRRSRLTPAERAEAGRELLAKYEAGSSIRQLRDESGYSIGRVRRLLMEAGVTFRGRGGAPRSDAPN